MTRRQRHSKSGRVDMDITHRWATHSPWVWGLLAFLFALFMLLLFGDVRPSDGGWLGPLGEPE